MGLWGYVELNNANLLLSLLCSLVVRKSASLLMILNNIVQSACQNKDCTSLV